MNRIIKSTSFFFILKTVRVSIAILLIFNSCNNTTDSKNNSSVNKEAQIESNLLGNVKGELGYPSEYIPIMNIYVRNIENGNTYFVTTDSNKWEMNNIPTGKYIAFAYTLDDVNYGTLDKIVDANKRGEKVNPKKSGGGYTKYSAKLEPVNDSNRNLLEFMIISGKTTEKIDINDFYNANIPQIESPEKLINKNANSNENTEGIYICENPNGIIEELNIKYYPNHMLQSIIYTSSKSKAPINLQITNQNGQNLEIKFPGDKNLYKLFISDNTVTCQNPDNTNQVFSLKKNDNTVKNEPNFNTDTNVLNGQQLKEGEKIIRIKWSNEKIIHTSFDPYKQGSYVSESFIIPRGKKWILIYSRDFWYYKKNNQEGWTECLKIFNNNKEDSPTQEENMKSINPQNINLGRVKDENKKYYSGSKITCVSRAMSEQNKKEMYHKAEIWFLETND